MSKKICLISDRTKERGKKIIKYLESLGGINKNDYNGYTKDMYYFIDENNIINYNDFIPKKYTLIELPEHYQYPKVMLVSDNKVDWEKRVVFIKKCGKFIAWNRAETLEDSETVVDTHVWKYAKDIETETIVELTLKDISEGKGVGVPSHLIRIKE